MKSLVAVFIMVVAGFASPAWARTTRPAQTPTLTVTGEGRTEVKPDFARVVVSISTQAKTLAEAANRHEQTATRARSMLEGLKHQGVAIDRADFTLSRDPSPPVPPGAVNPAPSTPHFTARTTFSLKVRPINELNSALSRLASSGLLSIGSVSFGVDHPGATLNQARRAAMIDARRQADVYADAGGFRLAQIKRVSSGQTFGVQGAALPMAARFASVSAQIVPPAQLTFRSAVTVAWRIAPR